jgi:hypothetical protein
MALQPHRLEFKSHGFEFILGMVLAMAMTILAITAWAAPRILTTFRLRRSRRSTGLTTRICTEGNWSFSVRPVGRPKQAG